MSYLGSKIKELRMENTLSIDLEQLEEQYGSELANAIKNDLEYAIENNHAWKFEVIEDRSILITFAFAYSFSTSVYEVSKRRKVITEKYIIGRFDCEKLIDLMNSVNQAE